MNVIELKNRYITNLLVMGNCHQEKAFLCWDKGENGVKSVVFLDGRGSYNINLDEYKRREEERCSIIEEIRKKEKDDGVVFSYTDKFGVSVLVFDCHRDNIEYSKREDAEYYLQNCDLPSIHSIETNDCKQDLLMLAKSLDARFNSDGNDLGPAYMGNILRNYVNDCM